MLAQGRTAAAAAGHAVYTPSLTGCAERAHLSGPSISIETFGRDVANLLRYEDLHDATLVATSCGGMAVARAAELEPDRVGRLILVDALIPFAGKSAGRDRTRAVGTDLAGRGHS